MTFERKEGSGHVEAHLVVDVWDDLLQGDGNGCSQKDWLGLNMALNMLHMMINTFTPLT